MTRWSDAVPGAQRRFLGLLLLVGLGLTIVAELVFAQTALRELQNRPAPVALRKCVAGANVGNLCNEDANCPGSTCVDRNVMSIQVAIHFNATSAQLTTIQNQITTMSTALFDATDGQVELGQVFIYNNAPTTGATTADLRIYPSTNDTWWYADTGSWRTGGSMHVSWNYVSAAAAPGETLAHEFIHLAFDARDEYESRPAGCGAPPTGGFSCPDAATIVGGETSCLMDSGGSGGAEGVFSELCWGQQGTAGADVSAGNHDATNVTEQSRCRSNRSCWAQVVWSWTDVILLPVGAPDIAANGLTVNPPNFLIADATVRAVLVLDESGSMSLDSPSRMERLKVAAADFVILAENGLELGIVSYSDDAEAASGRVNVPVSALGAVRTAWTTPIGLMAPDNRTNIGAGLDEAKALIDAAGGATANTFIVLMTDGLNNEPQPDPGTDLTEKLNALLAANIPVFVTCTGSDLGLQSQCSEIATATGGFYVDSADPGQLPASFVDILSQATGSDILESSSGTFSDERVPEFYVEEFAQGVTFTLLWESPAGYATMSMIDPNGNSHASLAMPQGLYVRVQNPTPGEWKMVINPGGIDSDYVARGYVRSQIFDLPAAVRYSSVSPGQPLQVFAYPHGFGGALSDSEKVIEGSVLRPDGEVDTFFLHDLGRGSTWGTYDDLADDGIFTGEYSQTDLEGAYTFDFGADFSGWMSSGDRSRRTVTASSPRFVRQARLSAAVATDSSQVTDVPALRKWEISMVVLTSGMLLGGWLLLQRRRDPGRDGA